MTEAVVAAALRQWELEDCPASLIAARENRVYRIDAPQGPLALRLHRPGYRTGAELRSELQWMAALEQGGIQVPMPVASRSGEFCVEIGDVLVDVLTFIAGDPAMKNGELSPGVRLETIAPALGERLALLHDLSDRWQRPDGFSRPSWDIQGLLGEAPLWGRFWDNPRLSASQRELMLDLRQQALTDLNQRSSSLDYGLVHADAVPENILVTGDELHLIDFDDGGFGYRLFDIATALNRFDRHDQEGTAGKLFVQAYLRKRPLDLNDLPLFRLLRSLTYVGWIIERMEESGSDMRCARFIHEALAHAKIYQEYTSSRNVIND